MLNRSNIVGKRTRRSLLLAATLAIGVKSALPFAFAADNPDASETAAAGVWRA